MTSTNATKRKMFIIATGIFLVTMSSVFFVMNDNKLDINADEVKTFVLQEKAPQDENFYRELLNNEDDEIVVLNNESSVEVTSTEFKDVKDQNFLTLVHPEDIPEVGNAIMEANDSEESIVRLKASTGEYKPYVVSMESLQNTEGERVSTAITLKDISKPIGERGNDNESETEKKTENKAEREIMKEDKQEVDKKETVDKRVTEKNDDREVEKRITEKNDDREVEKRVTTTSSSDRKVKVKKDDRNSSNRDKERSSSDRKEKPKKRKISSKNK